MIIISILAGGLILSPAGAGAYNSFNGVDCSDSTNAKSAVCSSRTSGNPIAGADGLLADITKIVSFVAGVAAVILIVIGSIRYIVSGGDSANVKKAKDTVFYALVGIAVIVLARTLILFVLSKL